MQEMGLLDISAENGILTEEYISGAILIDKPANITSHDVVKYVRAYLAVRKAGHCGTLDPIATGLMVVLIGSATRLSSMFTAEDKEYICTMALGVETDTDDSRGSVLKRTDIDTISDERIREVISSFKGLQKQVAPMISARHHNGRRLYSLARNGVTVERIPNEINIKDIDIIDISKPQVSFRVVVSKGTYVRRLCHDMGQRLGCGSHMTALRRIRSGEFHISDALGLKYLTDFRYKDLVKSRIIMPQQLPKG